MHTTPWRLSLIACWLAAGLSGWQSGTVGYSAEGPGRGAVFASDSARSDQVVSDEASEHAPSAEPVSFQPQPPLLLGEEFEPLVPPPPAAREMSLWLFGQVGQQTPRLSRWGGRGGFGVDVVFGVEAIPRTTTDVGSLLGKSPSIFGIGIQRRTPIVNDPRVRGSRVGQLAGSGSHWVPARIDLDTILSKIDSRIIDNVVVFKGPYSAQYGPGFDFIDVQLLRSPRYESGFQSHGSTSFDYQTNGQPWYGRQSLWGGSEGWGYRVGYGHRTGNDYVTGAGDGVPSSYKSRDIDVALGADLSADSSIEFNALRLDQTDVEYPGQAFDMDFLVTDGYELEYVLEDQPCIDRFAVDIWYNRTRFEGNAQRNGKRRQFPFFDTINYVGFTDVDSMSAGFRAAATWGENACPQLTIGVDLRGLKQELNEIASGRIDVNVFEDANSPIPKSHFTNPGLFVEYVRPVNDRLEVICGARADWVTTNVVDDPNKLALLGLRDPQSSLADILGTDEFAQSFTPWSLFATGRYQLDCHWDLVAGVGRAIRPPSLTELYVAESFLFLLQNGQNTATGDPRLRSEKMWQIDLGLSCNCDRLRSGINGFHAWINDYITFENLDVFPSSQAGPAEQVNLKYVNTELATLAGFELFGEYELSDWITAFATLTYVEGRDHSRNGDFATRAATSGQPSRRVAGLPRGYFSDVVGASCEPLPGVTPMESRLGFRVHQPGRRSRWSVEFSARVAAAQTRVATSLLETPTPGFAVFDLRSYWQATDGLLCVAGVENFTDHNYREHLDFRSPTGFPVFQPGINFYFGSELTY